MTGPSQPKPFSDMGPFDPVIITDENIEAYMEEQFPNNEEAKAQMREWFAGIKKFVKGCERCGLQTYADLEPNAGEASFIVEDLIPTKSVGILVAEWGTGKSPLAMQLQLSVMSGVKFLVSSII
ncbi:MAG: AAA family ATPase [Acidobacteriia bacterium]|nr:AAA family ATPase [Terriglobia bacterium]